MTLDAINAGGQLFWVTSRAAGVVALLAASGSVTLGVTQGAGWIKGASKRDLRPLHEALSIATLVAIVVHGLALLGDQFVGYSLAEIAIPFASSFQPFWTGLGVIAGWGMLALGLSYYARGAIGPARWRTIHRATAGFWLLAVVHGLVMGTDRGQLWFLATLGALAIPAALALLVRWDQRLGDAPPPAVAPYPPYPQQPASRPDAYPIEMQPSQGPPRDIRCL